MMRDFRDLTPPVVSSDGKTIVLHTEGEHSRVAVCMDSVESIMERNTGSRIRFNGGNRMDFEESLDDILNRLGGRV